MPTVLRSLRSAIAAAAAAATLDCAPAQEAGAGLQCFSTAQTRDQIEAHKLSDPFLSMRATAERMQGEALGARLCRRGDDLLYEISVLRRDGHIAKILVDAANGRPHSGRMND